MDPNSDENKCEREDTLPQRQRDDAVSVAASPSDGASSTMGMLQVPVAAMMTPPVPDAQIIAALEEEISDEEAAMKKPRGNVDVIEDDDSAPLPAAAMAAIMNDEDTAMKGKSRKGPEMIKGDDNAPPDHFASLHDEEEGGNLDKKPAASLGPATQPRPPPQSHVMAAPPNQDRNSHQDPQPQPQPQQSPLRMTVPSPTHTNQGEEINQDPPNTSLQDQGPTPHSMLPRPNIASDTQAPSAPIFELEATPVDDEIYDAEVVPAIQDIEMGQGQNNNNVGTGQTESEEEVPWWKRYQRCIIFGIVLVLCVVVAVTAMSTLLATQGSKDGGTENDEGGGGVLRSGAGPTKSPTILLDSNSTGEEQTKNSTLGLGSNSTVEELLDPTSDKSPTLSPSESSSDKPANAPTDNPATILQSILSSQSKLLPNDGAAGNQFGFAVAVDGDTVIVGAWEDDDSGDNSGSAYVFIREGGIWKQQAKLLPNDGTAGDRFGQAVSVSGDTVVVGADGDNGSVGGSAYVFIREGGTWKQQAKLLPNDGSEYDRFGYAVAVDGNTVVVGAHWDDDNGSNSGSAYVFIEEGGAWKQQAKLLPNDGSENDYFGSAVSVSGDTVVIGAHFDDDDNGFSSGSAYIFIREGDTWKQQAKLLPNDGAADDGFGIAVAISGDTVVVGALWDDDNGNDSGSAYLFIREGGKWIQQAKLLPNDGAWGDEFGIAVAISGNTVVIGAPYDYDNGGDSGSAYVFIREGDTWKQQAKLLPNDGAGGDYFGIGVAVSGDTVVVGARFDDDNGISSGSAYTFSLQS